MSVDQLVDRFQSIALQQGEALSDDDTAKYNRLYDRMEEVEAELRGRDGDQRRALARLMDHASAHVRLKSAIALLAVAPVDARTTLQGIISDGEFPEAGYAGSMLSVLEEGSYVPV